MPIKFRCPHCRQFLGISRRRAGQIVDCPTCGRTLRVPHLDGRVDPLPAPELDVSDERLAAALDELAAIADPSQADDEDAPPGESPPDPSSPGHVVALPPAPAPQVVPLGPPAPVVPVPAPEPVPAEPAPPQRTVGSDQPVDSGTAKADGLPSDSHPSPRADEPLTTELAHLAEGATHLGPPQDERNNGEKTRFASVARWIGAACAVVLAFVAGYVVGTVQTSDRHKPAADADSAGLDESQTGEQSRREAEPQQVSLVGTIMYRAEDGSSRPDEGARIIVLPSRRDGLARISIVGLRGADSEADFHVALAGLQALGGGAARADAEGRFEVLLPQPGLYHVVVLSHYQPRDPDQPIEPALRKLLADFFDDPDQLLGQVRYHFAQVTCRGEGAESWHWSFEPT